MADKKFPSLWIETGDDGKICAVMSGAYGPEEHLPFVMPAEDLVAAAEIWCLISESLQMIHSGNTLQGRS